MVPINHDNVHTYQLTVSAAATATNPTLDQIVIMLVYYDQPGTSVTGGSLTNDLDLIVTVGGSKPGSVFYGNGGPSPDRYNTAERVSLENPIL